MKKLISYFTLCLLFRTGCSDKNNNEPDVPTTAQDLLLISSYIRPNFYNMGRIADASMLQCNDLICVAVQPLANGSLVLDTIKLYETRGVSTFEDLITSIRSFIGFSTIELRLGAHSSSAWKTMITDTAACRTFAVNIKAMLEEYNLDGVDLDFEWAETSTQFADYSQAIVTLRETIGNGYTISAQLHPLYYALSGGALNALDYAFLQCYGPLPNRFPYSVFTENIQTVINYGVPPAKLVAGMPFYGVSADSTKKTVAYFDLVQESLIDSTTQNEATYESVLYVYNGQATIAEKTIYAASNDLAGMKSWDLASDVAYTDSLSLLKAMIIALKK